MNKMVRQALQQSNRNSSTSTSKKHTRNHRWSKTKFKMIQHYHPTTARSTSLTNCTHNVSEQSWVLYPTGYMITDISRPADKGFFSTWKPGEGSKRRGSVRGTSSELQAQAETLHIDYTVRATIACTPLVTQDNFNNRTASTNNTENTLCNMRECK